MAGITLEQAEQKLTAYLNAEENILLGQSTEINGRKLTRADLESVQAGVRLWDIRVKKLSSGRGIRVMEVIPR